MVNAELMALKKELDGVAREKEKTEQYRDYMIIEILHQLIDACKNLPKVKKPIDIAERLAFFAGNAEADLQKLRRAMVKAERLEAKYEKQLSVFDDKD